MDEPMTPPRHPRSAEAVSNLKDHASKSLSLYAVVVNGSFHCTSGGVAFRPTTFDTKEEAEEQAAFVRNNSTCGGDCRVVELSPASHPAPAGGKGLEERLAALESWRKLKDGEYVGPFTFAEQLKSERARLDAAEAAIRTLESHQGQAKVPTMDSTVANMQNAEIGRLVRLADHYRARLEESDRLRLKQPSPALESQPVLSVPEVKVPGHSVTEVDSINLQALHTTAIKCGMTNAYRGSLLQRIAKRMDDMHTEREPFSPQRTPAEVEGGESVDAEQARWQGAIYNLLSTAMRCLPADAQRAIDGAGCDSGDPLDVTISEIRQCLGAYQDALSTAPRGKVPSREEIHTAIADHVADTNGIDNATDAILALFTEGNARG